MFSVHLVLVYFLGVCINYGLCLKIKAFLDNFVRYIYKMKGNVGKVKVEYREYKKNML